MSTQIITTKSLSGLKAVTQAKGKKIGKVYRFVFHPSEKRVVGILVRRPDAALMFHRKDLFVALNGFHVEDGQVIVHDSPNATDRGALKALGVNWDDCVIWVGMPVLTKSEEFLGYVDVVSFDALSDVCSGLTGCSARSDVVACAAAPPTLGASTDVSHATNAQASAAPMAAPAMPFLLSMVPPSERPDNAYPS